MNISNNLFTFITLLVGLFISVVLYIIADDIVKTTLPKLMQRRREREIYQTELDYLKGSNSELQYNLTIVRNNNLQLQEKIEELIYTNELLNIQLDSVIGNADYHILKKNKSLSVQNDMLREELNKTREQVYSYNFM
jgi:hypothetical protein